MLVDVDGEFALANQKRGIKQVFDAFREAVRIDDPFVKVDPFVGVRRLVLLIYLKPSVYL